MTTVRSRIGSSLRRVTGSRGKGRSDVVLCHVKLVHNIGVVLLRKEVVGEH